MDRQVCGHSAIILCAPDEGRTSSANPPQWLRHQQCDRSSSPIATEWFGGSNRMGPRSVIELAGLLFIIVVEDRPATYKEYVIYSAVRNCYYHVVRGRREISITRTAASEMHGA